MPATQIMRGMTVESLGRKRFLRLHYSADEDKTSAWAAVERENEADPRNWDKQMEMRRIVTDGIPVFARYNDSVHCPLKGQSRLWALIPDSLYFGGWDAGQTLNPAFVLKELTPSYRIRDLLEVVSVTGESMDEFAPRVMDAIVCAYPGIIKDIRHVGDATIVTRSGADKTTAKEVAARYGFDIKPVTNDWTKRKSAVDAILNLGVVEESGVSRYVINGKGCPVLRRGFQGMYKYNVSKSGESHGPGAVILTPSKDGYSHVQDANQYASMPIFDIIQPKQVTGMTVTKSVSSNKQV